MKKTYLLFAVFTFLAITAMSQTDVTPANWKFSKMALGNARSLFVVEGANIGGNLSYPFRLADSKDGAFAMNDWRGPGTAAYSAMTDAEKQSFEDFYAACNIVDGGAYGNLFCYQGKNSTVEYPNAVKNVNTLNAPSLNVFSNNALEYGFYRVSITVRFIANDGTNAGKIGVYVGTSHWDGVDAGTYRQFDMNYVPAYNGYWVKYQFDFEVKPNTDPNYKVLPFNTKLGLGAFANQGIIIMRDLKLEKISAIDPAYKPVKITPEAVTGLFSPKITNDLIAFAKDGVINVVDAQSTIEVYSAEGKLVAKKSPSASTLTVIPVQGKGMYVVKAGNSIRKVML